MSYTNMTVSDYGTEISFLNAFIHALTASDERITCSTADISGQFGSSQNTPSFTLGFDNAFELCFTRAGDLSQTAGVYIVSSSDGRLSNAQLRFNGSDTLAGSTAVRMWRFRVFAAEDALRVDFGGYDTDMSSPVASLMVLNTPKGKCWAAAESPDTAINSAFLFSDNTVASKFDRLDYTYQENEPARIEIVKNKVLVTAAPRSRVVTCDGLYDCTEVRADTFVSVNAKNYYALDSHTLMEV